MVCHVILIYFFFLFRYELYRITGSSIVVLFFLFSPQNLFIPFCYSSEILSFLFFCFPHWCFSILLMYHSLPLRTGILVGLYLFRQFSFLFTVIPISVHSFLSSEQPTQSSSLLSYSPLSPEFFWSLHPCPSNLNILSMVSSEVFRMSR